MSISNNFTEIWTFLKQLDYFAGTFLLQSPKRTWKEKFLALTLPLFALNGTILVVSTVVLSNFSLISMILSGSGLTVLAVFCYLVVTMKKNKTQVLFLLDCCRSMYDVDKKFHPVVRVIARAHLLALRKKTLKIINLFRILFYINGQAATIGFAIIGVFLPESIYPKYSLPFPYVYPFKNPNTWFAFVIGVAGQAKAALDVATLESLVFAVFYCIIIHIMTFLDIIRDAVDLLKDEIELKMLTDGKNHGLGIADSIDADSASDKTMNFTESVKIIVELVSDVNDKVSLLRQFFSGMLLLAEIASFASLFIFGMLLLVVHQQYFFAVATTWFPFLLFFICFANEKILDKFAEIKCVLYNTPWYALSPKERKTLLITMECDNIQGGFTAGTFHALNNERFGHILNAAYSNCIVLRDLVKK